MSPVQRKIIDTASSYVQLWQAVIALVVTLGGVVWGVSATYAQHAENTRRIGVLETKTERDHDAITGMEANIEWIVRTMGGDPAKVRK